ncbi:winged helix-turn-helix domain-containing protein [Micromonospora sp. SL4-19]|uniref:winged helix-turn-helix domain-containing protein n=1 Tax=Micromonospora sp. SL4-19 TaxID=3399129 RepID=UPI003A4DEB69
MEISDPRAVRALAHPLRLDLLELLAATGPATAAQCGRALDVPQANCSFHLRQLAKYGFVEDAGPGGDKRERKWRVPHARPRLRITAGGDALLRRQLERVVVEREMQAILSYVDRADEESSAWAKSLLTAVAVLTAEEAADINQKVKALLEPYISRTGADGVRLEPGQQHVRYFMAATPMPNLDPADNERDSDD